MGGEGLTLHVQVFGATGGSGRAIGARLIEAGHAVTAVLRDPAHLEDAPRLSVVAGDAMTKSDVAQAVPGHDAIMVSLGGRPEPFDRAPVGPGAGLRDGHAAHRLRARGRHPPRIVLISACGVGDMRESAPRVIRLYLRLFMRDRMADKERQEALLRATNLDFLLVRPVALTDGAATGAWSASPEGGIDSQQVSRHDLEAFLVAELAELAEHRHQRATVALSGVRSGRASSRVAAIRSHDPERVGRSRPRTLRTGPLARGAEHGPRIRTEDRGRVSRPRSWGADRGHGDGARSWGAYQGGARRRCRSRLRGEHPLPALACPAASPAPRDLS